MELLKQTLHELVTQLNYQLYEKYVNDLNAQIHLYPFNECEFTFNFLLAHQIITLDNYNQIKRNYIDRNKFLHVFEISAPRSFGETWAQSHLKLYVPELIKPSKKLDADYVGQYDFYLDNKIKIEVKASRAVNFKSIENLSMKALSSTSIHEFNMNFQQLKPKCCDIFIWVAVWTDVIRYWIISSKDILNNKFYSVGQHRGNIGEGQLHLNNNNINEFIKYETTIDNLLNKIRDTYSNI